MTERHLTREGWVATGVALALLLIGAALASNAVLAIGALAASLPLVSAWLATRNLGELSITRQLPAEVYAGRPAPGAFLVENRGVRPSCDVWVAEADDTDALGHVSDLPPGVLVSARARWRFGLRGRRFLDGVVLFSTWPFGLVLARRTMRVPVEVLVYPTPSHEGPPDLVDDEPFGHRPDVAEGHDGDFLGLRSYRPGDALRAIHWRTSARAGEPLVVQRTSHRGGRRIVRVPMCGGKAWEEALSRATGAVLDGFQRGLRVGLELPGERLAVGDGPHWRRRLLDRIAEAPYREGTW